MALETGLLASDRVTWEALCLCLAGIGESHAGSLHIYCLNMVTSMHSAERILVFYTGLINSR